MHTPKLKQLLLAVCFSLGTSSALAASLGNLLVLSNRGEPFNAEVEILADNEQELAALKAALAPPDVYAARDMEPPSQAITVEVGQNPAGEPVLLLHSAEPIAESALDLLIQLNGDDTQTFSIALQEAAPESEEADVSLPDLESPVPEEGVGEELPEFTPEMAELESLPDLLDEHPIQDMTLDEIEAQRELQDEEIPENFGPLFVEEPQPEPQAEMEAAGEPAAAEPVAAPVAEPQEMAAAPAVAPTSTFPADGYAVQKGDTLRNIAVQHWADGVSLEQMMAGLYRANPHAFAKGDMNRLKTGEILRAPNVDELKAIDQADAEHQVNMVARNWDSYRNKLAAKVSQSAPVAEEQQSASAVGGKIDSVRDQSTASGPRDVVKLSSGDTKGTGKGQSKVQLQEDLIARDKALKEAEERIASLEKQLQDAQRLLELRKPPIGEIGKENAAGSAPGVAKPATESGYGIATLQEMLQKQPKTLPVAGLVLAILVALAFLGRRGKKKPLTESSLDSAPPAEETPSPAWAGAATVAAAASDEEHVPVFVTSTPELEPQSEIPSENQVAEPDWSTEPVESQMTTVLGIDDIASLMPEPATETALEPEAPTAENGMTALADLLPEPAPVETAPQPLPAADSAGDESDFAAEWAALLEQQQPAEIETAPEVEATSLTEMVESPVEEAATTLDVDDIFTAPQESSESAQFEQSVSETEDMPLAKAEVEPDTAEDTFDYDDVFESQAAQAELAAEVTPTTAELADSADVAEETDMDAMVAEAMESGEQEVAGEDPLDLDDLFTAPQEMPLETAEISPEAATETEPEPQVDEMVLATPAADDHSDALAAAFDPKATEDLADLDFGFDIDLDTNQGTTSPAKTAKESVPPLDFSSINLNVGEAAAADVSGADEPTEVDTKLDLVTAYIDMNDEDGAKELLLEILKEGGPKQVAKAQAMLDQLGSA